MEPRTAKSYVFLLKKKSEIPEITCNYIAMAESHFSKEQYRVRKIRTENDGENMPAELLAFCDQQDIVIKASPARASESNRMSERLVQEH